MQISYQGRVSWVPTQFCMDCDIARKAPAPAPPVRDPSDPGPKPDPKQCRTPNCLGVVDHVLTGPVSRQFWLPMDYGLCVDCVERDRSIERERIYNARVAMSGLPGRYRQFSFDHIVAQGKGESVQELAQRVEAMTPRPLAITRFNAPAAAALRAWTPGHQSLYLAGPVGGGKTTLVAALLNRLMRADVEVCYLPEAALYENERAKMNAPRGARVVDLAGFAMRAQVLAIDDLGTVENMAPWQKNVFERIIAVRYEEQLPIIVTSNLRLGQVGRHHSERAASRLAGMCRREYELIGFDWRTGHLHTTTVGPPPSTRQIGIASVIGPMAPRRTVGSDPGSDRQRAAAGERDED